MEKEKNVFAASAAGRNTASFLDTQRYLTHPSSKNPSQSGVYYPKNVNAPRQSRQPSPVPSASQHIYISYTHATISFVFSINKKVGIGCRQRDRRPFQQHQSRSLSASVGLIADEKEARREIRFNTCMIDLHHLENGQICLRIYVLDTYTQESCTRTAALLSTWLPRQRQTFSELVFRWMTGQA